MIYPLGRARLIGIAVILVLFFAAEFALNGIEPPGQTQQAQVRR